jgi:hypothetical protein
MLEGMSRRIAPATGSSGLRVTVRRTGGFAGLRASGELDLDGDDPRAPEVAALVDRVDLAAVAGGGPQPDRYVYEFDLCGPTAIVAEQHLTSDLRRIAELVLGRSSRTIGRSGSVFGMPIVRDYRERSGEGAVERGRDVERGAGEDRDVGVGLADQ